MQRALVAASVVGAAYLTVCLAVLTWGFPNEDALILFKYANNVARGHGVVYFAGGPHAEGATDFLWMLGLAASARAGIDVAVAAAIFNAAAAAACAAMFVGRRLGVIGVAALVWLLVSPPAVAGYVGFGTMTFSAIALFMFLASVEGGRRVTMWIPLAALVASLLRPDGAILGVGFVLVAYPRARALGVERRIAVGAIVGLFVGAAYFVARARYFGEWLPLPLYVKRHTSDLSGVTLTLEWIVSVLPTVVAIVALAALARRRPPRARAWLVAFAPLVVHVASFATAAQSQNIANRFQAPMTMALACVACRLAGELPPMARSWRMLATAVVMSTWMPGILAARRILGEAFCGDYIEAFAPSLPSPMRIATTEAGNLPYWVDAEVLDLVGLNSRETARQPPTSVLLERFAADLILLHPAGALDGARLAADHPGLGRSIVRLDRPLCAYLRPERARFYADGLAYYRDLHAENVIVAPIATFAFLDAHPDAYEVYLVPARTNGGEHVVAVRRGWEGKERVLGALEASERARRGAPYLRTASRRRAAP